MKNAIISMSIGFALLVSACDTGADGTLESCATILQGSYDGDRSGLAVGHLDFDGSFRVHFRLDNGTEQEGSAKVNEDGDIVEPRGNLQLTGAIDFDTCEASGNYEYYEQDRGTWSLSKRGIRD